MVKTGMGPDQIMALIGWVFFVMGAMVAAGILVALVMVWRDLKKMRQEET